MLPECLQGVRQKLVSLSFCSDVFETCYQIMASGDQSPVYPQTNQYVVDPDGAGGVEPFEVTCDMKKTQNCATTEVLHYTVLTESYCTV